MGSKNQLRFNKNFRNKTLSIILLIITTVILIAGITSSINKSYLVSLVIVTICCTTINFSKGVSEVLITRYLSNFAKDKILTQIYAVNAIIRNALRAIISFFGSYLLRITTTAHSMIMLGILLFVIMLGLISYMKPKLGKRLEQYDDKDICKI